MAYDRLLADRVTRIMEQNRVNFYEKEMMGGITWIVEEKMCMSIYKGGLMARIEPDELEELIQRNGATQMMHSSKPMKGYLSISPEGFDLNEDLGFWVKKCLEFNPKAKASKKKK